MGGGGGGWRWWCFGGGSVGCVWWCLVCAVVVSGVWAGVVCKGGGVSTTGGCEDRGVSGGVV